MKMNQQKTAFILEDDQDISSLLSIILKEKGLEVYNSASISTARKVLEGIYPAIIFIDHRLPDGLGFEYLPELREMFPLSYIIAITANDSPENKELSYVSGADKYIEKPFQYNKLNSLIRSAL